MCTQWCKDSGMQSDAAFCLKVAQFQELLDVRHSVMLIGPAGCGKSTIWRRLPRKATSLRREASQPKTSNPRGVVSQPEGQPTHARGASRARAHTTTSGLQ